MIYLALVLIGFVVHTYLLFWMYGSVMSWQRARDEGKLTWHQKLFAYPGLVFGLMLDFSWTVVWGTILFFKYPQDWLLTGRLIRYKKQGKGWRFKLASYLCEKLLDSLDPKGCHCRID